jgi:hypothetical protein
VLDNLGAYMSPYGRDVVDAALADYDFGAGQTRAQQDLDLAGAGAFGGSGAALTRSMTEDALVRGRAATTAKLRDDMFRYGADLSNRDAERRQQTALAQAGFDQEAGLAGAAGLNRAREYNAGAADRAWDRDLAAGRTLADVAGAYEAGQRANAQTQAQIGEGLRNVEQQQLAAPVTHAQQIVALLNGLPIGLFSGEQKNATENRTGTEKKTEGNFSVSVPFG